MFNHPKHPKFGKDDFPDISEEFNETASALSPSKTKKTPTQFGQTRCSLFGGDQPTGDPFGAPQTMTQSGFEAADQNKSTFGQARSSTASWTDFFDQPDPANSPIFGAAPTQAVGATAAGGSGGTAIAKYQPSIDQDETFKKKGKTYTTSNKFHCISMMSEFKGKSIEELRLEDYVVEKQQPEQPQQSDDEMRAKMVKLETYCKLLTKENSILKMQIAKCLGFRTSIHALGQCLDGITLCPPVTSPLLTELAGQLSLQTLQTEKAKTEADPSSVQANNTPGSLPVDPKKAVNFPTPSPGSLPLHHSVIGQPDNVDSLPTVSGNRWLFVTRFARSVTQDQISDYMARRLSTRRRPVCIGLTQPQDHPLKPASFKIELPPGEFKEALSPNFWDRGVLASEYRSPANRNIS